MISLKNPVFEEKGSIPFSHSFMSDNSKMEWLKFSGKLSCMEGSEEYDALVYITKSSQGGERWEIDEVAVWNTQNAQFESLGDTFYSKEILEKIIQDISPFIHSSVAY